MSALPILYSFRRCPYAMRARMALSISDINYELREVALKKKPAEMLAVSPKATVPVLVLPDNRVIDESLDIMRWALAQHDPENWLSVEDGGLIALTDGDFKYHLDRYKYPVRYGSDMVAHRERGLAILNKFETVLQRHENLCRMDRSLADMAIFPFVRQFAETDRAWFEAQSLPRLQSWLRQHLQSLLFEKIMIRHNVWQSEKPGLECTSNRRLYL
jgi:glutathione S-transferase